MQRGFTQTMEDNTPPFRWFWRRMQLDEELRHEVTPKNILMIGPTGVGKTEIARRLAKLANASLFYVAKFRPMG